MNRRAAERQLRRAFRRAGLPRYYMVLAPSLLRARQAAERAAFDAWEHALLHGDGVSRPISLLDWERP